MKTHATKSAKSACKATARTGRSTPGPSASAATMDHGQRTTDKTPPITGRKRRCDSPLNRLPEDRQSALIDFLRNHTAREALQQLAAEGVTTSESSLSKFRGSYKARQDLQQDSGALEENIEQSQQADHGLTPEQLFQVGQERLMIRAIRLGSHTAWANIHQLRQTQERLSQNQEKLNQNAEWRKLAERRLKRLEQKTAPPVKPKGEARPALDPEEHAAHVRRSFGLPEDYVFPGVREREQKAREQEEQKKQHRAARSNKKNGSHAQPASPQGTPHSALPTQHSTSAAQPAPVAALGTAPHSQPPKPAPSAGAWLCSVPLPAEPAAASANAESPAESTQPKLMQNPSELKTEDLKLKTPDSPLPPEPPYWHFPANQAPVNLPEERMCIAELLNVPLPGDKYLRMGHVGLDLASKTKAFYPRLLCKVEFLTPEFVREMMNDIRRGAL